MLYDPVIVSLKTNRSRVSIALAAFALLPVWRIAPWIVVLAAAAVGALFAAGGR